MSENATPAAAPATVANFAEIVAQRTAEAEAKSSRPERTDRAEATTDEGMKVSDLPRPKRTDDDEAEPQQAALDDEYEEIDPDELDPLADPAAKEPDADAELGKLIAAAKKSGEPLKAKDLAKFEGLMVDVPVLDAQGRPTGAERSVPFADVINGHLRQSKLTRELERTYNERAQAAHILQLERERWQQWQNPAVIERDLTANIHPDVLHAWHMQWAKQQHAYITADPQTRQLIDQTRQLSAREAQLQDQLQRMQWQQQQAQQQQPDPATANAEQVISANMDRSLNEAFRDAQFKHIKVNDRARGIWLEQLRYACDGGPVTRQACKLAAQAVVEILQEQGAATFEALKAQEAAKPKEVPARRVSGAAPPQRDERGQFVPRARTKGRAAATPAEFRRRVLGE